MDGEAGFERWELRGEWKSRRCPRRIVTSDTILWLQLYSHYKAGHLLAAGGVLDQPALYIAAMNYIESAYGAARDDS